MPDHPRLHELRRRVQADPASIAFAQLAEEYRRLGAYDEAVAICRVGLRRHPDYLSARVTLGRALVELGVLDEAERELQLVAAQAPDNLAAIRGLAEIYQRRGQMNEALTFYRRALTLARHDPDITEAVERISQVVEPPPPAPEPMTVQSVEELFDFDRLLEQLGEQVPQVPQVLQVLQGPEPAEPGEPGELAEPAEPAAPVDLRDLEAALRQREVDRAAEERTRRRELMGRRRAAALHRLEAWLRAIEADRLRPNHA